MSENFPLNKKALLQYQLKNADLDVEFEIISPVDFVDTRAYLKQQIRDNLDNIESQIQRNQQIIDSLNSEIDRLTNHADGVDYAVAVASGILCGLIDSFFVGEFSLDRGIEWGSDKTNNFVKWIAEKQGYSGDTLDGATSYLEKKFPFSGDSVTHQMGGGAHHHFRDFSHHASPIGLIFSLITQFSGNVYGIDARGGWVCAKVEDQNLIGKDLHRKIILGVVQWFFHIVSDMAGSSGSQRKEEIGTGLPGPLLSLMIFISSMPFFNHEGNADSFAKWLSHLFNGTLLADRTADGKVDRDTLRKFDLRAEIGVLYELGRQAIPVIINEAIVRTFYFVRRLHMEFKEKEISSFDDFIHKIDWKKTLPANNRTITRMLTISTGTFVAVDLADAAIRSGLKSGGEPTTFLTNMVLSVNFVGVGRFAIAVYSDLKMGYQRQQLRKERWYRISDQIYWHQAKIFYKQGEMWIAASEASEAIQEMENTAIKSISHFCQCLNDISDDMVEIGKLKSDIDKHNPFLLEDLSKTLKY